MILVVDTSRSMQAEDVEPTRLGAAQEAVRTFLDRAPDGLRVGLVVFAGEAQVATPPTQDHELVDTAVTDIDEFLVFGGTAIGDALQTAVELGRQVTDLVPNDDGEIAAPARRPPRASLAQAASCRRGEEPRLDPLPLRRRADPWPPAAARGRRARKGGVLPRLHDRARDARRRHRARPVRRHPGRAGHGAAHSRASRPRDAARDRGDDGRRVLRGAHRGRARAAYDNLGSRLGREPGESEITWLFLAIAAGLLLVAGRPRRVRRRRASRSYTATIVNGDVDAVVACPRMHRHAEHAARTGSTVASASPTPLPTPLAPAIPTNRTSKTPVSTRRT